MKIVFCLFILLFFLKIHAQEVKSQLLFRNGESQIVPAFKDENNWLKEELWVETNFDSDQDGKLDRMHVFVTRPSDLVLKNQKLPVIYSSSPYYGIPFLSLVGLGNQKNYWKVKHELGQQPKKHRHSKLRTRTKRPLFSFINERQWIPRGYVMVYSSSPGTGLSDGSPTIGGENESLAPKAVIDWLCGRAKGFTTRIGNEEITAYWCSGKIGMTGTSYDGTLCIAAATTGVKGLEAILPIAPVTSFYNYYRSNGLVRSPEGYVGEDMDVLYDLINTGNKKNRKYNNQFVRDSILVKNQDRKTGDYNEFWASRDYLSNIDSMKAALFMAHGFNDWNVMTDQSFRFYQAAKKKGLPVKFYYHQDGHGGEPPFELMNKWFTKYLHGIDNGFDQDSTVYIVREHQNSITNYTHYPDANAQMVDFYLNNPLNNTGDLNLVNELQQQKLDTLKDDYHLDVEELIQTKYAANRLLFLSPILQKNIRISGVGHIQIELASDQAAANLSVYLVTLPWEDGKGVAVYDNIINRAWADPQNYKSLTKGELLKDDQFYTLNFDFMPDDQVIEKGKQIGLLIFSSDKAFTLHPKPGTQLIINLMNSKITLPIVGGKGALEN